MAFVVEPILAVPSPAPVVVPTSYPTFNKRMRVMKGQSELGCKCRHHYPHLLSSLWLPKSQLVNNHTGRDTTHYRCPSSASTMGSS
jgi:hypothetical protein